MKSINWKRVYTHIGIIAVFFVITAIYMRPLLEGKTLSQMDDKNAAGMSQELNQWEKQTGEYALWTNAMFGGMPAYLIKGGPSYNIYAHISRVIRFGTPYKSYAIMLSYLIAFYLAMLAFGFKPLYALLGAVAFGFSSYNFIIIEAGHVSKAYAIAYMAPVLGTFYMTFRGKYVWGGILTAFALGIQIAAAHPQITYYLFLTLALMAIAEAIHAIIKKTIKPYVKSIAVLGIAVVLAVLPNITNLMTTMEYGKSSIRGPSELSTPEGEVQHSGLDKTYALSWSYGKSETFTMLVPGIFGGGSTEALSENSEVYQTMQANRVPNAKQIVKQFPVYWGDMPFTSGPVYIGAIICFLFVLGLILVKGPARWWLLAATIFSIVLAWGRNFPLVTDFFFYNFPYYNKFRAVSMTLVVAGVTMPLLGLMAIREVL
ncbi:MAG: hypothetical protein KKA07_04460, partial [Bacteroidetes bacterium]|nr:hypothetical protein [Bacteroidota bacterium]